jgi:predicted N-formylglutamate amidohydrolase
MVRAGDGAGKSVSRHLFSPAMPTAIDADAPFERIPGDHASGLVLLCDHATNRVPPAYGDLGLPAQQFARHIAYDIGAARVTRGLAARFGAPALLTRFSRLVIDPNRGEDDPTLVMRLSDGAVVPGNARVDSDERRRRIETLHRPYHDAVAAEIDASLSAGIVPALVSIHSFTPFWKEVVRPWHVAVLWDADPRLNLPLIAALEAGGGLVVGDNQPYDGALRNDTLFRHGTRRGLAHTLIEVRQDLIETDAGADAWAGRLHAALAPLLARPEMHEIRHFGSRTGPVKPWPTSA